MLNREDLVRNDNAIVSVISLAAGECGEWHYHSDVTEYVVCLEGDIRLDLEGDTSPRALLQGELNQIAVNVRHRVFNGGIGKAKYLMVQNGCYDFIRVP